MIDIIKRIVVFLIKVWLVLVVIGFLQLLVEDLTSSRPEGTTIIRGEYKVWKPVKWKAPDFPIKK